MPEPATTVPNPRYRAPLLTRRDLEGLQLNARRALARRLLDDPTAYGCVTAPAKVHPRGVARPDECRVCARRRDVLEAFTAPLDDGHQPSPRAWLDFENHVVRFLPALPA